MRNRVTLVLCFAAAACSGAKINHLSSAYQPTERAGKDQIAPALGQVAYSGAFKPPCNQPTDHETCDLEAQWYAAQAAQESANWGWWQMILSGFGFVGLLCSLVLTRQAVRSSEDATKDAEKALTLAARSAEAAVRQVEISMQDSERKLRPYVSAATAMYGAHELMVGDSWVQVLYTNRGQTPAFKCIFQNFYGFCEAPIKDPVVYQFGYKEDMRGDISPGAITRTSDEVALNDPMQKQAVENGSFAIVLLATARYQSVGGTEYEYYSRYYTSGQAFKKGQFFMSPGPDDKADALAAREYLKLG
jgi:hypothetical protein